MISKVEVSCVTPAGWTQEDLEEALDELCVSTEQAGFILVSATASQEGYRGRV